MFEPLKITASPQCGIISDRYLPIDAILYYQVMRERLGEQTVTLPGQSYGGPVDHSCPLKKLNTNTRQWFYAASFAQWPDHAIEGTDHWNKRLDLSLIDLVDWQGRKPRADISAGRYKSYHMPVFYRVALSVSWYVVGERTEIERLLAMTTHVGKKIAYGWGAIVRWDVEPVAEDWSVWDGTRTLMRAIPEAGSPITYGLRPSYWLSKHQFPVRLPN